MGIVLCICKSPLWFLHGEIWCLLRHLGWSLVDCLYERNFRQDSLYHSMWRPSCVCGVYELWRIMLQVPDSPITNLKMGEFPAKLRPFLLFKASSLRLGNISLESRKSGSETLNVWYVLRTFTIQIGQIQVSIPVPLSIWGWIEDARPSHKCECHRFGKTPSIWAIYYKSLTWFKAIWGDLGWGRYKLPRCIWRIHEPDSFSERFGWTFKGWTWVKMVSFEAPSRMTSKHLRRFGV